MEKLSETTSRKLQEENQPKKKARRSTSDTIEYIKERNEAEFALRREQLELKRLDQISFSIHTCYRKEGQVFSRKIERIRIKIGERENMNSAHCKVEFGVEKADPVRVADALQIPAVAAFAMV
ncbi:uncharacterized protein [Montipora foliosa]|uniref:uncharacterized protein n=1 Tax=Montipora foliosa TaxID=591990 RepID=UPI0035F1BB15